MNPISKNKILGFLLICCLCLQYSRCHGQTQVPQTINAWYNYSPATAPSKLDINTPHNYTTTTAFWSQQWMRWKGSTVTWDMDTTTAFFGSPWSRSGFVFRTKFPGIAKNNSVSFFGDSAIAACTFHFANIIGQPFANAFEWWQVDSSGTMKLPLQLYIDGHHSAGYYKYPTVAVGYALEVGNQFSFGQWNNVNGTLHWDANNEPGHIRNLPSTSDFTTTVPLLIRGDSLIKGTSMYPVWYKESSLAGPNNYTIIGTSDKSVIVGGNSNFMMTALSSAMVGGNTNRMWGGNAFGVGDNEAMIGGFQNIDSAVDAAIIGGDDHRIHPNAAGSVIIGGGQNNLWATNASIIASGFSDIEPNASSGSIISGANSYVDSDKDTVFGSQAIILGGIGLKARSYGEVNVGQYNTDYTASSINHIALTDRSFNVGNGSSKNARADAFTILKNGHTGINAAADDPSLILDVKSSNRAFAPPRMTTTQKLAITSPTAGSMVYDTTLNQMSYFNGTTWVNF